MADNRRKSLDAGLICFKNDGKKLEHFISVAEEMLTPKGFEVEVRNRTYSDAGDQLAEFDLIVRGNFGSEQCLG